ncbi:hypothetical protein GCM10022255_011510 [Dactylosporangium darangshiense]|uniref:DUF726 domain-containing protein n=1 Tax=Dactylosporangium darangshiense TaxID=579108 RepID=A0ABP8CZ54_9ACTN
MTDIAAPRIIHTGPDGTLASTSAEQVAAIAAEVARSERAVLHFHGGLVNEASGMATANGLAPVYAEAGAVPVFFVWRSGFLETVTGNLREILAEDIFGRMLKWVLQFAVGKVRESGGGRAFGGIEPAPGDEVDADLHARHADLVPFAGEGAADISGVSQAERDAFERVVSADPQLRAQAAAVLAGREPGPREPGARGIEGAGPPVATRMDPGVLDELAREEEVEGGRGLIGTALLARKCASVLVHVVARFRAGSDHGVYSTVVEELLREFYLGSIGAAVWAAMKGETADTFAAGTQRGGRLFLDGLAAALATDPHRPQLTLVGHSTGAVFIDNLLTELGRMHGAGTLPDGVLVRNVAFLAPACTSAHFAAVLGGQPRLFERFRMFTMSDEAECADRLLGAFYPRSLLYLVSGILERDAAGASACMPLAGLARYLTLRADAPTDLVGVRDFLLELGTDRLVRSPSSQDAPLGMRSGALTHADFDNDPLVLASLRHLVATDHA